MVQYGGVRAVRFLLIAAGQDGHCRIERLGAQQWISRLVLHDWGPQTGSLDGLQEAAWT